MTLKSTNLAKTLQKKTTQRRPGNPSTTQQRSWIFQTILVEQKVLQQLLPTGNTSPAPRFYGLPKIHKANCPM